ncbi:hypothetical protein EZV62_002780 [Acer yangbiense]|uniref:glutathione transferase n=1 Tax=Acer yangbiense TaxID=1000413 RepID=A0A5C7IY40_9ROSI|nr:hypothetical protein EZV62_002780 [Acer yangbiense]
MADQEEVKLYGFWSSPFSRRIELALKLKGVPYVYIEEDLTNKSPSLLKYNPVHKKIPVLVHNDKPVAESLVILEYIDETWKNNPILPLDPHERATARFWASFIDNKILATVMKIALCKEEEKEAVSLEVCEQLKMLEQQLNGKDFFGGDKIGFVDIVGNIVAFWFQITQEVFGGDFFTPEKFPGLFEWIGKLQEIDLVNECTPPREKNLAYVPYEYIEEDLFNKSPSLLKYNPVHKKIPVLVHNEKPVAESQVILEYIDETWKNNPILPQDSYERAMARFWARFIDEKFLTKAWEAYTCEEKEREVVMEQVCELMKILEKELDGKDFFGGDSIGFVDIVGNVVVLWFQLTPEVVGVEGWNPKRFPGLLKWVGKLQEFDVVNESMPPIEKYVAYIRASIEAFKSAPK